LVALISIAVGRRALRVVDAEALPEATVDWPADVAATRGTSGLAG
jgi:hypothetical protein